MSALTSPTQPGRTLPPPQPSGNTYQPSRPRQTQNPQSPTKIPSKDHPNYDRHNSTSAVNTQCHTSSRSQSDAASGLPTPDGTPQSPVVPFPSAPAPPEHDTALTPAVRPDPLSAWMFLPAAATKPHHSTLNSEKSKSNEATTQPANDTTPRNGDYNFQWDTIPPMEKRRTESNAPDSTPTCGSIASQAVQSINQNPKQLQKPLNPPIRAINESSIHAQSWSTNTIERQNGSRTAEAHGFRKLKKFRVDTAPSNRHTNLSLTQSNFTCILADRIYKHQEILADHCNKYTYGNSGLSFHASRHSLRYSLIDLFDICDVLCSRVRGFYSEAMARNQIIPGLPPPRYNSIALECMESIARSHQSLSDQLMHQSYQFDRVKQTLQAEIDAKTQENKFLIQAMELTRQKHSDVEHEYEGAIIRLEKHAQHVEGDRATKQIELQKAVSSRDELTAEIDGLKALVNDLEERIRDDTETHIQIVKLYESENAKLEADEIQTKNQILDLKDKLKTARKKITETQKAASIESNKLATAQERLIKAEDNLKASEDELNIKKLQLAKYIDTIGELNHKIITVRTDAANSAEVIDKLKAELIEVQAQATKPVGTTDTLDTKFAEIETQLEKSKQANEALNIELVAIKDKNTQATADLMLLKEYASNMFVQLVADRNKAFRSAGEIVISGEHLSEEMVNYFLQLPEIDARLDTLFVMKILEEELESHRDSQSMSQHGGNQDGDDKVVNDDIDEEEGKINSSDDISNNENENKHEDEEQTESDKFVDTNEAWVIGSDPTLDEEPYQSDPSHDSNSYIEANAKINNIDDCIIVYQHNVEHTSSPPHSIARKRSASLSYAEDSEDRSGDEPFETIGRRLGSKHRRRIPSLKKTDGMKSTIKSKAVGRGGFKRARLC